MGRVVLRVIWRPSMISRAGLATESNVESYGGRATTALAQRVRQHRGTDGRGGHWHRAAGARPCRRRRPAAPGRAAVPARRRGQSHAAGRRHARRRAYPAGTRSCHCRLPHRGRAAGGPGRPVRRAVANCRQPAADQARAGRRLPGHRLRTAGPHGRRCAGRGDRRGAAARAFGSAAGGTGQPGQPHHREPAVKQPSRRASRTAPVRPAPLAAAPVRNWLRQPAYWLLMGLLLAGAWRLGAMLLPAVTAFPLSTALAIVLFGLYAVPFMLFIRHLDYFEREPPVLLAAVFAWGALVAIAAAVPGNAALNSLVAKLGSPEFAATWGPALVAPVVEEPLKLLGVVVVALLATEQINSVVDGFVYGAVAGLGFQVIENVLYAANAVAAAGLGDRPGPVLTTLFARGFVAGLWSHTLFSALAGAGVGYAVVRHERSRPTRAAFAAVCLLGALVCHGLWNSPLIAEGLRLGAPGVLVELLVRGTPALVVILALVRSAGQREASYYGTVLADLDDEQIATPAEIQALATPGGRAAARRTPA